MSKRLRNTVNFSTHGTAIILVLEPNRRYKIPTRLQHTVNEKFAFLSRNHRL